MQRLLWILLPVGLGGCFTFVGTGVGVCWGLRHNYVVDRDNAALPKQIAPITPIPTGEQHASCEARRRAASAAVATATSTDERARLLSEIPNCLDVYAVTGAPMSKPVGPPAPQPHGSIAARAFIGLLVGAAIDGALLAHFAATCHEC